MITAIESAKLILFVQDAWFRGHGETHDQVARVRITSFCCKKIYWTKLNLTN